MPNEVNRCEENASYSTLNGNVRTAVIPVLTPKRYLHFRPEWYTIGATNVRSSTMALLLFSLSLEYYTSTYCKGFYTICCFHLFETCFFFILFAVFHLFEICVVELCTICCFPPLRNMCCCFLYYSLLYTSWDRFFFTFICCFPPLGNIHVFHTICCFPPVGDTRPWGLFIVLKISGGGDSRPVYGWGTERYSAEKWGTSDQLDVPLPRRASQGEIKVETKSFADFISALFRVTLACRTNGRSDADSQRYPHPPPPPSPISRELDNQGIVFLGGGGHHDGIELDHIVRGGEP